MQLSPKKYVAPAAAFLIGALAMTAIPAAFAQSTNTIYGCTRPITGLLRIIGANDHCGPAETPISWTSGGGNAPGPVTVGGGLTGKWQGMYVSPVGSCNVGNFPIEAVFVQDSQNNLTGSFGMDTSNTGYIAGQSILGSVAGTQVEVRFSGQLLQGTLTDQNHINGTVSFPNNPGCGAVPVTWSIERNPLLP